jgi:ABC-type phosphate transport system substrate-binding protein
MKLQYLTIILVACFYANIAFAEVAVIVNPGSGVSSMSDSDVKRIFLAKVRKVGSEKAVPVDTKEGNAARDAFYSKVVGKDAAQIKSYWSTMIFSGKGTPPKELGSDADVVDFVAKTAGAIGYVDAGAANGSVTTVLKVK